MGATFAEGIASYLIGHGYRVEEIVHINPLVGSPGDIRNADHRIREKSNDSNIFTRHRSPIDSQGGNFWKRIRKKISSSLVDSPIRLPNHTRTNKENPNQKT